jgi:hypothetical protein
MTGKRSMPHVWWARRDTLLAVGGTALAVWMVVGAWMLFAPSDHDHGFTPDQAPSQTEGVLPTQQGSTDSSYDPGVYTGPLNTPTFSPHPSRLGTATSQPGGSTTTAGPTSAPHPPSTTSSPTTSGPGHGHGNGHGHKP